MSDYQSPTTVALASVAHRGMCAKVVFPNFYFHFIKLFEDSFAPGIADEPEIIKCWGEEENVTATVPDI